MDCYSPDVDELTRALPLSAATAQATLPSPTPPVPPRRRTVLPTWFAAIQVAMLCGLPTLGFVTAIIVLGTQLPIFDGPYPTLEFIALTALLDTALVALLIRVFLMLSGETSKNV